MIITYTWPKLLKQITIHWRNIKGNQLLLYSVDSDLSIVIYPLDIVSHLSNNWGLDYLSLQSYSPVQVIAFL